MDSNFKRVIPFALLIAALLLISNWDAIPAKAVNQSTPTVSASPTAGGFTLTGKIAFMKVENGHSQIYVVNADGTHERKLSNDPLVSDTEPAWSPDGKQIAFVRFSPTGLVLYTGTVCDECGRFYGETFIWYTRNIASMVTGRQTNCLRETMGALHYRYGWFPIYQVAK